MQLAFSPTSAAYGHCRPRLLHWSIQLSSRSLLCFSAEEQQPLFRLRIYGLDAAVIPAGSSSIALVGWMGLQYLALPYTQADWIAAAMVGNSLWLMVNILLTGRFLYRTVRFLNDDDRLEVFKRFAVHVALPRDLRSHLLGLILQRAQEHKLLPGAAAYVSDEPGSEGIAISDNN